LAQDVLGGCLGFCSTPDAATNQFLVAIRASSGAPLCISGQLVQLCLFFFLTFILFLECRGGVIGEQAGGLRPFPAQDPGRGGLDTPLGAVDRVGLARCADLWRSGRRPSKRWNSRTMQPFRHALRIAFSWPVFLPSSPHVSGVWKTKEDDGGGGSGVARAA
ncbi:hypothetical protein CI238_03677, partial [Colletotrichum incanum]